VPKFVTTTGEGRRLIGLGLSAANLERLREKKPVHFHLDELGLPWNLDLLVFYGETESDMVGDLKAAGLVPEDVAPNEPLKQ